MGTRFTAGVSLIKKKNNTNDCKGKEKVLHVIDHN